MNYSTIHLMLGIKNIYALLFVFLTQLGCSSRYPYQMNPKDTKDEQPGVSEEVYTDDVSENIRLDSYHLMYGKVEKLLAEDCFNKGVSLTDDQISSAISILNKDINIFNSNLEYKEFLKRYGSIYGAGFKIYGPISNNYEGSKVNNLVYTQNSFITFGEDLDIGLRLKSCWAVAYYKNNFYYIDSSSRGKGYIYRVGFNGEPERFAKNFLEFLDNVFRRYELDKLDSDPDN